MLHILSNRRGIRHVNSAAVVRTDRSSNSVAAADQKLLTKNFHTLQDWVAVVCQVNAVTDFRSDSGLLN